MGAFDVSIRIGASVEDALQALDSLAKRGEVLGRDFQTVGQGLSGVFDPLFSALTAAATAMAAAGGAAYAAAEKIDGAFAIITAGTGASGEALEDLKDSFRAVAGQVPDDMNTVARAVADLNTRLGLTGDDLEVVAKQFLDAADMLGGDVSASIAGVSRALNDWGVSAKDTSAVMDKLFVLSQKSGITIQSLGEKITTYGTSLRELGFGFDEAAAMLANFERAGVNTEQVLGTLRVAIANMAKSGVKDISKGFSDLVARIRAATDETEALRIGIEAFGSRGGAEMVKMIREGKLAFDEYVLALQNAGGAISKADAATETLSERFQTMGNRIGLALEPVGRKVQEVVGHIIDLGDAFLTWLDKTKAVQIATEAFAEAFNASLGSIDDFKTTLDGISMEDVSKAFQRFGEIARSTVESIKKFGEALVNLASSVPWEWLAQNAETLINVIVSGWAAGKIAAAIGNILSIAAAFKTFGAAMSAVFTTAGPYALAAGLIAGLVVEMKKGKAAADAYTKALESTTESLKALGAEKIRENIRSLSEQIDAMRANMGGPNSSRTGDNEQIKVWLEQLDKYKLALEELESPIRKAEETASGLAESFDEIGSAADAASERTATAVSGIVSGLGQSQRVTRDVRTAINETLFSVVESARIAFEQMQIAIRSGVDPTAAMETFKSVVVSNIKEASMALVQEFGNPQLANMLDAAFVKMANGIGGAFGQAMSEVRSSVASTGASVASAVTTAKSAIAELQSSLDAQRSAQEQYANQREAIEKRITEIEEQERALRKQGQLATWDELGRLGAERRELEKEADLIASKEALAAAAAVVSERKLLMAEEQAEREENYRKRRELEEQRRVEMSLLGEEIRRIMQTEGLAYEEAAAKAKASYSGIIGTTAEAKAATDNLRGATDAASTSVVGLDASATSASTALASAATGAKSAADNASALSQASGSAAISVGSLVVSMNELGVTAQAAVEVFSSFAGAASSAQSAFSSIEESIGTSETKGIRGALSEVSESVARFANQMLDMLDEVSAAFGDSDMVRRLAAKIAADSSMVLGALKTMFNSGIDLAASAGAAAGAAYAAAFARAAKG